MAQRVVRRLSNVQYSTLFKRCTGNTFSHHCPHRPAPKLSKRPMCVAWQERRYGITGRPCLLTSLARQVSYQASRYLLPSFSFALLTLGAGHQEQGLHFSPLPFDIALYLFARSKNSRPALLLSRMACGRKLLTTFLFLAILLARIPHADAIPCHFIIVERRSIEANDDGHQRTLESEGDNDSSGLMRRASKEIDRHLIAGAWSATLALGSAALSVTSNAIKMNDAQKYGDKTKSGAKAAAKERPRQNERGSTASSRQKEHSCPDERRPDDFALRHGHHHHESPTSALCSADSDSESDSDDGPSLPHSHRRFEKRAARHSSAIYDSDNSKDQIISDVLIVSLHSAAGRRS